MNKRRFAAPVAIMAIACFTLGTTGGCGGSSDNPSAAEAVEGFNYWVGTRNGAVGNLQHVFLEEGKTPRSGGG